MTLGNPTRWLTSDLHIDHANICAYTGRPYRSVLEMNEDLVARWNRRVTPKDSVVILGDLCMGKLDHSLLYISRLNGTKYLCPGNHDRMWRAKTPSRYESASRRYLDAGIAEIWPAEVKISLVTHMMVTASHFPYSGDSHEEDRFADARPIDHGERLIHGHTHGKWRRNGRMIDVGIDAWGGYPVSFAQVAGLFMVPDESIEPLPWLPSN